jgi:hypothetical protein
VRAVCPNSAHLTIFAARGTDASRDVVGMYEMLLSTDNKLDALLAVDLVDFRLHDKGPRQDYI